jgi:hypothetical protein
MASAIYPKYKEALLTTGSANIGLTGANLIKAVLVDTGTYTYSAAHDFYNDLSGVATTGAGAGPAEVTINNVTVVDGRFETTDDTDTFTSVDSGASCEALVIFVDTGNVTTDRLVAYIDGFSVTPNGGNITVDWSDLGDGFDGIFQL